MIIVDNSFSENVYHMSRFVDNFSDEKHLFFDIEVEFSFGIRVTLCVLPSLPQLNIVRYSDVVETIILANECT